MPRVFLFCSHWQDGWTTIQVDNVGSDRLLKQLGCGGCAGIYLDEYMSLRIPTAIKTLCTRLIVEGSEIVRQEAL